MASKTVARSGSRNSRSRASTRTAPRRKPVRRSTRQSGSPVAAVAGATSRGARAAWLLVARGAGTVARSVGHARDIEPGHRRDGIALALLGAAFLVAAASWFDAARPVGSWLDTGLRFVVGTAVVVLPVVMVVIAVSLMRSEPDPASRPRLILGAAMIALPALGLWHLWAGSPQVPAERLHAAGFVGFVIGGPLSDGVSAWVAAPLLFIAMLFGVLLLSGTTIRDVPATVRAMFGTRGEYDDEFDEDDYDEDYYEDDLADD